MANRGLRRPLTREALEGLLANPSSQRFLPEIHLALPHGPGEHTTLSCRLMYVRLNGFMLIIPNHSDVPHVAIEALKEPGSEEQPLFQPGACLLETQRGRELTEEPVQLVNLTWTYVGHFTLPHFGQHAVPRDQVLGFMPGDSTCRPRLAEAQGLAADWLVSMDATTAQEYLTGEEFMDEGEDVDPPPAPEPEPQLVSQLQARIAELETRLQDRSTAVQPAPVAAPPQMKAPLLFPGGTPPNVSTAGKTPNTGGESPSQSFFSRNSPEDRAFAGRPVGARLCGPQPRGRRSRGGESGTAPGSQDFRSNASADVSADAAKFCTLEEAHSCQNSGPCVRSFERGRRRGQRARQQLRRQRVHGQGRICPGRTGSGESIRSDSCQFAEGTGHSLVTGDGISASEVCGKEDSSGRASPPEPICLYDFRSLDDRFQQPERRVARDPQQDAFLRRTVCHRPRALSSSLAIDGVARTPVPNSGVREEANQPAAVLQTVPPGLDRSQPCFPQRSGLFREPRSSCAQTCEEQQTRRRRRSAEDQKAKTPERKRQRQRSGSATEFERHHRSVMQPVHRWHAQLSTMDGLDNFPLGTRLIMPRAALKARLIIPRAALKGWPILVVVVFSLTLPPALPNSFAVLI